jgi:hypothetical protein
LGEVSSKKLPHIIVVSVDAIVVEVHSEYMVVVHAFVAVAAASIVDTR